MMSRLFFLALVAVVISSTGCSEAGSETLPPAEVEQAALAEATPAVTWISFPEALAAADSLNKAVLVDVYASWCPWCAKMQDSVYTRADILAYVEEHFVTARLNVEQTDDQIHFKGYTLSSSQLASGFGAEATPTTVFLTATGDYITRLPGYLDAEGFMKVLRYIGTESYKHTSFEQFVQAEGD